jgi:hypothetical protein
VGQHMERISEESERVCGIGPNEFGDHGHPGEKGDPE